MNLSRAAAAVVVALAMAGLPVAAADAAAKLLDEAGAGVVGVNAETRLRIKAIEGQLVLQGGEPGEIEFRSESPDKEGSEIPVSLWTDGDTFRLEPPQGHTTIRTRLNVSIPPGLKVRLELENASVNVNGIDAELSVVGRQLQVEAQNVLRPAQFDVEGGAVRVHGAPKGVGLRGRDLDVVLERVSVRTDVRLTGGTAKLIGLQSGLQGDFTGTRVSIDTVAESASLTFERGSAAIARLRDGGDIVSTGAALKLEQSGGRMSIVSDSQVQFNGCSGTFHVENSAGSVVGVKHDGVVEVTTQGAQVALGQIQGQLRVAGDGLDVKLQQIRATVGVLTRSSNVTVELASEAVTVENDGGDVTIKSAEGPIDLKTRGGRVQIVKARGPVTVQADNEDVDVEWDVLTSAADSKITNEGGSVTVRFPPAGDARIDAASKNGRVESALTKVVVNPDGGAAQGVANGGGSDLKTVTIQASGDVRLLGTDATAADDASGQAP